MRNVTDSECDCLPDCDFLDLHHSVTDNNLMWVSAILLQNTIKRPKTFCNSKKCIRLWPNCRRCDSRNLNLSPLCSLKKGTLPKFWMQEVGKKKALQSSMSCVWIEGSRDVLYIKRPKSFVHIFFAVSHAAKTQGQSSYQRRRGREMIDAWPFSLEHKPSPWPTPPDFFQSPSVSIKSPDIFLQGRSL